jgi:hypothetical protein
MWSIVALCAAALAGCSRGSVPPADALGNLKAQAEEMGRASLRQDHQRMADLTHPALVRQAGGRSKYIQMLDSTAKEIKSQGFGLAGIHFEAPSALVESAGNVYAVIPYKMDMTGPGGAQGTTPGYFIGVSADGGRSWKFVDGAGADGDRGNVKQMLPGFPDELALPPKQSASWHGQ